jgi:hypothetical protein
MIAKKMPVKRMQNQYRQFLSQQQCLDGWIFEDMIPKYVYFFNSITTTTGSSFVVIFPIPKKYMHN